MPRAVKRSGVSRGFEVLQNLQPLKPETLPRVEVSSDEDVPKVLDELRQLAGGHTELIDGLGRVLRRSLDRSYDGALTGRFHLAQLSKTEKAHTGSLFELELQRELKL